MVSDKLIKKVLLGQTFEENTFEYSITNVELSEGGLSDGIAYDISVHVKLPNPKQSYVMEVFIEDVHKFLSNIWQYIGESFSYTLSITLNAPHELEAYISPEKYDEIVESVNSKYRHVELKGGHSFNVDLLPLKTQKGFFMMSDTYLEFYFNIRLGGYKYNGKSVEIKPELIPEFCGVLAEELYDSEQFKHEIENTIYDILEPEIHIQDVEVYINSLFHVTHFNGEKIEPVWHHMSIDPDVFFI
jgi:hypothetical protein